MTTYRTQFTYSASSTDFTPGAAPEDVFVITGNAATNVYILKMGLSTTQTAAGINRWLLVKLSTPDTGGTSAAVTAVPYDSSNPAAGATVLQYTANPAAGTAIGAIWNGWVSSPLAASAPGLVGVEVDFMDMFGQPLTLLSANESLAWNFNAAALPGGLSVCAYCVWYEMSKT